MRKWNGGWFWRGLVLILCLILWSSPLRAAQEFERVGIFGCQTRFLVNDSRAAAMGTAYTALAGGISGAYWNMGALGISHHFTGLAVSDNDYLSSDDTELYSIDGYSGFDGFGFGMHFTEYKVESVVRTVYDPEGVEGAKYKVSEKVGIFGAGLNMRKLIPGLPEAIDWGIGLGLVYIDSGLYQMDYSNWDLDFGTQLIVDLPVAELSGIEDSHVSVRFGWALRNATKGTLKQENEYFKIRRRDRAGLALEVKIAKHPTFGPLFGAVLAVERRKLFFEAYESEDSLDLLGFEITGAGIVSVRRGIIFDEKNLGDDRDSWGVGLGLKPGNRISPKMGAQIDYTEVDYHVLGEIEQFTVSGWIVF